MVEILRSNDLVLISVIESLLKSAGIGFFVADQHGRLVAPQHPRRRRAAPHVALVDHVVVQERRRVHEFDRRGELDVARSGVVA